MRKVEGALALFALALGLAVGISVLGRGAWLDEFWTLASARSDHSWAQFAGLMAHEVHPPLHYGLIQIAQWLGVSDLGQLRALNILGVPFVLLALWHAWRAQTLSVAQISVALALYASSPMFLDSFAELRAYFFVFSTGIATAVAAQILLRTAAHGDRWRLCTLALWGVSLAAFVNLHYFATLMGGLLTLAIVIARRGRGVWAFLVISALAAAPALALFVIQRTSGGVDIISWIQTGRIDAVLLMFDQVWAAGAGNIIAFGIAAVVLLTAIDRREIWGDLREAVVLCAALAAFFALLTLANAVRPLVIDRYLIAAGGCVVVAIAIIAGSPHAPRCGVVAICAFAVLSQARALYTGAYQRAGWNESAAAAAEMVRACPDARVFMEPALNGPEGVMLAETRRVGQLFYAARQGFAVEEIALGEAAPAPGACPNLIWAEHILNAPVSTEDARALLGVELEGAVDYVRAGSGVILVNTSGEGAAP